MRNIVEEPDRHDSDRSESERGEQLHVFEESNEIDPHLESDDGVVPIKHSDDKRLRSVRQKLADAPSFHPSLESELSSSHKTSFAAKDGTWKPARFQKLRKWFTLAVAALGIGAAGKLEAEDLSRSDESWKASQTPPPVFQAPAQEKSTNVFVYPDQKKWEPTTPEEVEAVKQALEKLRAEKEAQTNTPPAVVAGHQDTMPRGANGQGVEVQMPYPPTGRTTVGYSAEVIPAFPRSVIGGGYVRGYSGVPHTIEVIPTMPDSLLRGGLLGGGRSRRAEKPEAREAVSGGRRRSPAVTVVPAQPVPVRSAPSVERQPAPLRPAPSIDNAPRRSSPLQSAPSIDNAPRRSASVLERALARRAGTSATRPAPSAPKSTRNHN